MPFSTQAHIQGCGPRFAQIVLNDVRPQTSCEVLNGELMSRWRSWSHMHLSTHEFVALAVDGELTKFLETQFRYDFGAHEAIIHLDQTPSQPAQFQFSAS